MKTLAERFWAAVKKADGDGCWEWTRSTTEGGYGQLKHEGKHRYAHHVGHELLYGHIPDGMHVLHACDNPRCVRHLFLGTHDDNMADMAKKGRAARMKGSRSGRAKLDEDTVLRMREEYQLTRISYRTLGEKYGVSHTTARHAVAGINWEHL